MSFLEFIFYFIVSITVLILINAKEKIQMKFVIPRVVKYFEKL